MNSGALQCYDLVGFRGRGILFIEPLVLQNNHRPLNKWSFMNVVFQFPFQCIFSQAQYQWKCFQTYCFFFSLEVQCDTVFKSWELWDKLELYGAKVIQICKCYMYYEPPPSPTPYFFVCMWKWVQERSLFPLIPNVFLRMLYCAFVYLGELKYNSDWSRIFSEDGSLLIQFMWFYSLLKKILGVSVNLKFFPCSLLKICNLFN